MRVGAPNETLNPSYLKSLQSSSETSLAALQGLVDTADFTYGAAKGAVTVLIIGVPVIMVAGVAFAVVPITTVVVGSGVLIYQLGSATVQRYKYGQGLGTAVWGGALDITGVTGMGIGLWNKDLASGWELNLSSEQRGEAAGAGIATAFLWATGGRMMRSVAKAVPAGKVIQAMPTRFLRDMAVADRSWFYKGAGKDYFWKNLSLVDKLKYEIGQKTVSDKAWSKGDYGRFTTGVRHPLQEVTGIVNRGGQILKDHPYTFLWSNPFSVGANVNSGPTPAFRHFWAPFTVGAASASSSQTIGRHADADEIIIQQYKLNR